MDYKQLSKTMSHALRHAPEQYGLTLDPHGWVGVSALVSAIGQKRSFKGFKKEDIDEVMRTSNKQRYEVNGDRIRAFYGHSVVTEIELRECDPPTYLYHGTTLAALESIKAVGLSPMSRQRVHYSTDVATAKMVAARKPSGTIILTVCASKASVAGIKFYWGNEDIWMSDALPAEFIEF